MSFARIPVELAPFLLTLLEMIPQRRQPDITRARNILGWEPQVEMRDGLNLTIDYMRQKLGLPTRQV